MLNDNKFQQIQIQQRGGIESVKRGFSILNSVHRKPQGEDGF